MGVAAGVGVSRVGALVAVGAGVDWSGKAGDAAVGMRVGDRSMPAALEQATRVRAAKVVATRLIIIVPVLCMNGSNR